MFAEKNIHYFMEIPKSKMAELPTQKEGFGKRIEETGPVVTIIKHGNEHYQKECEDCGCIFEYDKVDIKDYYENGYVEKIRCPECGRAAIVEEGEKSGGDKKGL